MPPFHFRPEPAQQPARTLQQILAEQRAIASAEEQWWTNYGNARLSPVVHQPIPAPSGNPDAPTWIHLSTGVVLWWDSNPRDALPLLMYGLVNRANSHNHATYNAHLEPVSTEAEGCGVVPYDPRSTQQPGRPNPPSSLMGLVIRAGQQIYLTGIPEHTGTATIPGERVFLIGVNQRLEPIWRRNSS